jgi:serine/threonine protein kinase
VLVQKSDGEPVLVDFGLAYVFEGLSSEDLTTRYTGSMGYIPEEVQANVRLRTQQHDVYSSAVAARVKRVVA